MKPGEAATLEDLESTTIGVKGKLPASIEVMLSEAGLVEDENFDLVPSVSDRYYLKVARYATDAFQRLKLSASLADHDVEPSLLDRTSQ